MWVHLAIEAAGGSCMFVSSACAALILSACGDGFIRLRRSYTPVATIRLQRSYACGALIELTPGRVSEASGVSECG